MILLINPLGYKIWKRVAKIPPPLNLAYLVAILGKNNHQVKVLDLNISRFSNSIETVLRNALLAYNPTIVGIPFYTIIVEEAEKVAREVKRYNEKIVVIAGGPHATAVPDEVIQNRDIDLLIKREGEISLLEVVSCIKYGKGLEEIKGISFRKDNRIVHTPDRELVRDLDSLPSPAWDKLDLHQYQATRNGFRYLPIITSRGCPYRCIYCQKNIFGETIRFTSAEKTIAEIEEAKKRYGYQCFIIYDDCFTLNHRRLNKILDIIIEKELKVKWFCQGRVNTVNYEILKKMKRAGCIGIGYGIESGSTEILKKINKNITLAQVREAAELTRKAGIPSIAGFMIGFPWDTHETIRQTISLAHSLPLTRVNFFLVVPYPATTLYNLVKEMKLLDEKAGWERYGHFSSGSDVDVAPLFHTQHLSTAEVSYYVNKARSVYRYKKAFEEIITFPIRLIKMLILIYKGNNPIGSLQACFRYSLQYFELLLKRNKIIESKVKILIAKLS